MPCHRLGRQICPRSHRRAAGLLPMWKLNRQRRLQLVGDENLSSMAATPRSVPVPLHSRHSPTVIEPSPSSAKATPGLDRTSKITSSPTNRACAEVSYITGVPTMISPEDATTSSMTVLASLMDRQVTGISENSTKTTSPKTMGINMSQLRKLFIPKLDKNNKGSMSLTMQTEIEILRAQKKVTGGEIAVDEGEVVLRYLSRFHFLSLVLARGPSVCAVFFS
ncbi:hypothetical protein L210DRAFT_3547509 [Boletus edulis BED1]|uniref:Uncharacterized protein n=1 Tax=Boletus edulis BED1 TaxID=1328754 RepID=A0AAD4BPF7_BOLED|nr:hypothetical protein L210DRAFT_3547509 [Boletus edulis BED1]